MRGLRAQIAGPIALDLAKPFVTARGRVSARRATLVRVGDGVRWGYGEATPLEGFSEETSSQAWGALGQAAERLAGMAPPDSVEEVSALIERVAGWAPASARFAIELALLDLAARRREVSVAALLNANHAPRVAVNGTIGSPDIDACREAARELVERGFTCIKIKVGGRALDDDIERVRAIREVALDATLRLDANGAWSRSEAAAALDAFSTLSISLVEQPVAAHDIEGLASLRGRGVLIAADESVRSARELERILERGAADVVVLKPALIGGVVEALEMQRRALDAGVQAIVTTLLDGAVGRAGALHMSAASERLAGPCGLATGGVLATDLTGGRAAEGGAIALGSMPGLGLEGLERWFDVTREIGTWRRSEDTSREIPHPLWHRERHDAQRVALRWEGGEWTWGELAAHARRLASELACRGVTPGDRVGVQATNAPELVALAHAISWSGAIFVALHPDWTPDRTAELAARARCALIVSDALEGAVSLAELWDAREGACQLPARISLDAVHTILFTSGTTGEPKMAALTWGNHVFSATGSAIRLGHEPTDRWLAVLPMCHIAGMAIVMRGAILGITVVVHESFDAARVARAMERGEATIVSMVSRMLWRVLEHLKRPDEGFRAVLLGGGAIPPALMREAAEKHVPVAPTYGMTEACSQVATARPGAWSGSTRAGAPLIFTQIALSEGEHGELEVRGPTVSPGYVRVDEDGRLHTTERDWFATGDWVREERGELEILDRRTDLIVTGGENVYPARVEAVLVEHPWVSDACVVGITSEQWGQQVTAALVASEEAPAEPARTREVLEWSRERLAHFQAPRRISWWEGELPRSSLQKVQRGEVRRVLESGNEARG